MSRGFVKEGDQEELPVIPPRASLPAGVTNYVTPAGHKALIDEKDALEAERKGLSKSNEAEHRRSAMVIDAKMKLLDARIASARVVEPGLQPPHEVRFGAIVEFNNGRKTQQFQIVGVDEANIKQHKIAFTAPVAQVMIGKKVNEIAEFKRGREVQQLTILNISYD